MRLHGDIQGGLNLQLATAFALLALDQGVNKVLPKKAKKIVPRKVQRLLLALTLAIERFQDPETVEAYGKEKSEALRTEFLELIEDLTACTN